MEALVQHAKKMFGIHLNQHQVDALSRYEDELIAWNQQFNLTAIRDPKDIRIKHFLDSFSCALAWGGKPPRNLIDIGTGAGFPGIPLKIIYPGARITLVESIGKKTKFCQHIIDTLKLDGIEVIQARAEELGQTPAHRESYDWVIARAVANMRVLSEYLLPLAHVGGVVLAQKGESGPAEAQDAEKAIKLLGGEVRQLIPVILPGVVEERHLVIVDKIATTPPGYPRKPGVPAKKPL
ncbi:MAG: 16S rRNA (guanine(527)-N(7))-methyltransferase RsmG [Anaerolineales bacterium]